MNAGNDGPIRMFLIPRYNNVNKIHTAFCSYHESTIERGKSFTPHPKTSASATATLMALYASLHCPYP